MSEGFGCVAILALVASALVFGIARARDSMWLNRLEEAGLERVYLIDSQTGSKTWTIKTKGE